MPQGEIKWGPVTLSHTAEAAVVAKIEQLQAFDPADSKAVSEASRPVVVSAAAQKGGIPLVLTVTHGEPKGIPPSKTRVAADDPLSTQRVEFLSTVFKRAELARWIGVSPSQTSRWATGKERPGPAAAAALIDLEHVYSRARLVWGGDAARIWLESPNAFLSGTKPIDVLLTDGPARILEALDAEMWGGAA
ncbi:antitoxin Xre/MbcA/ParS toxin-binding domain-containing protein [Mycolicibacterium llatzerense]|uniref:antitoxin Xre/MbcA/ParS toxin-binding domain-containing protein n=1 Tax=Mycolicibacterium llatzerense TaxID=280871 RepID=UPI0009F2CA57|nr:antitoxin Xre/MbcA/ParS toxin-binding domain-containing protein [Mycolicibacterium llatzerense]